MKDRPKLKNCKKMFGDTITARVKYSKAMEKHCDELEKALDKACEELSMNTFFTEKDNKGRYVIREFTKEEWKEWLLR